MKPTRSPNHEEFRSAGTPGIISTGETHELIIFKNNFEKMSKEDMLKLKQGILLGILTIEPWCYIIDYDVAQNITDVKVSCLIIKSNNRESIVALQSIVNNIPDYKCQELIFIYYLINILLIYSWIESILLNLNLYSSTTS